MGFAVVRWSWVVVGVLSLACAAGQKPASAQAPAPPAPVVSNPAAQDFPVFIGKAPVKVDGELADWPALPTGLVSSADGKHAARLRLFFHGDRVYVAFEVTDATPTPNRKGPGENWQGDAVELFLGTHEEPRSALGAGDVQVIVSYNPAAPLAWNYRSQKPMTDAAVVVKDVAGGWRVEASFTLAELGITAPAPGKPVWIDFALDNSDGADRAAQYAWLGTEDLYQTPSMWKRSVFATER